MVRRDERARVPAQEKPVPVQPRAEAESRKTADDVVMSPPPAPAR
jgi:hypothetical protein